MMWYLGLMINGPLNLGTDQDLLIFKEKNSFPIVFEGGVTKSSIHLASAVARTQCG
jgi:hypothetical protein